MLAALRWRGEHEEVQVVATDIFRNHLLNLSTEAAQAWGEEFWRPLPHDALESAAVMDSNDLADSDWRGPDRPTYGGNQR